ncbi:MAG TPA: 5-deoxy-glucuronate isomerase [Bauldia sp.]|nr:5-deoxy-glucuronate isomerase [Bauldia sp.]
MAELLVKPSRGGGRVQHITPASAGWTYVGFDLYRLAPGEKASAPASPDREVCLVFISGKGRVIAGNHDFGEQGGRTGPFGGKPHAIYVPAGNGWTVTATTACELAVCSAPGHSGSHAPRAIGPDEVGQETRGRGTNIRYVTNILPESAPADSLLVVEVITPGGHTSSYPPHKHDKNDLPRESQLEETYYHRLNPPQGFAFQRVYTDDRSLDEAIVVEDGDVVLVPRGYHPVAAVHGYDLYYLNVMAGPVRTWKFYNAPEHEWMLAAK